MWLLTGAKTMGMQTVRLGITSVVSNLKPTGRLEASRHLRLAISLPLRNQQALSALLRELQTPGSPNYRKYLTPAQFAEKFGPAQTDYDAVIAFATAHGLTVTAKHPNRMILDLDGAVPDIEKALHVTMRTYQHPREPRQFYAPDADPALDLPVPVLHVSGLDDYSLPHPNLELKPAGPAGKASPNTSGAGGTYAGVDFRAAYVPGVSLSGSGQSVGLLEFDGYYASDISSYQKQFGPVTPVPLVNVAVDGGVSTPGSGNDEVSLDIEMAMSMAPGLSAIYVYEAPNGSPWVDILDQMANDDLVNQMSCSWSGGSGADPTAEQIFQQMAAQGQTFFQASGDSDAYTGAIPFPCDSPNLTVAGATTLTTNSGGSYSSETVWNWGGGVGSSGGISTTYAIPEWQQAVSMSNNQGSTTMRNIPDLAMVGDNIEVIYDEGQEGTFAGTSCAAPLWAAFTALVNQQAMTNGETPVGFINPAIYAICEGSGYGSDFHDITTGNNFPSSDSTMFSAVQGFDLCIGWGSPAGAALINALAGANASDPLEVAYSRFVATGTTGGTFTPVSKTYTLINGSGQNMNWTASATQSWLTLSSTGGTIAASGSATVVASINAGADGLSQGIYADTITFTDGTTGVRQTRPVVLIVQTSGPILIVNPGVGFSSSGYEDGPFTPPGAAYAVTNAGNAPMTWSARSYSAWLTLSPTGGTLAAGGTTSVTASIGANADSLATGTYSGTLHFSNSTNHSGSLSLTVTLAVGPPGPTITSATTAAGTVGVPFSYQIIATNSPSSYSAAPLAPGLACNPSTGVISGTPNGTGTFIATLAASNSYATGTAALMLAIPCPYSYTISSNTITITGYTGSGGALTIPSTINGLPVNSIGAAAFANSALTSVTIPSSVTSIGADPFSGCSSLASITVNSQNPDYVSAGGVLFNENETTLIQYPAAAAGSGYVIPGSVTAIGTGAFSGCTGLTSVTIPDTVTAIGSDAFSGCTGLTSVTLPASVASIGAGAFSGDSGLTQATFLGNAPAMGSGVFQSTAHSFVVDYYNGATGFTTPTWDGYASDDLAPGNSVPSASLLVKLLLPVLLLLVMIPFVGRSRGAR
jgi:hypothetical protein